MSDHNQNCLSRELSVGYNVVIGVKKRRHSLHYPHSNYVLPSRCEVSGKKSDWCCCCIFAFNNMQTLSTSNFGISSESTTNVPWQRAAAKCIFWFSVNKVVGHTGSLQSQVNGVRLMPRRKKCIDEFQGLKIPILRAHQSPISHSVSTRVCAVIPNSYTPNEPDLYVVDVVPRLGKNFACLTCPESEPCLTMTTLPNSRF